MDKRVTKETIREYVFDILGVIPAFTIEVDRQFLTCEAVLSTKQYDRETLSRLNLMFPKSYYGGDIWGNVTTLHIPISSEGVKLPD